MKNTFTLYLKNHHNKLIRATEAPFKTENELEEYINKAPEILSDIDIIKRQVSNNRKDIPDMIGVDRDNNIVIIENKNVAVTEDILPQILRYAFWAQSNPDSIKALWLEKEDRTDVEIDWDNVEIRIIIIAPYIKPTVLRLLRNIKYKVELIEVKRFHIKNQENILINKLEDDEETIQKTAKGLVEYNKKFYESMRNVKSVDRFMEVADEIEKIVKDKKMALERKNNKYYVGFKQGFFNIFGISWIGTKSFGLFLRINPRDFNKIKRISPYKLDFYPKWKQAYLKLSDDIKISKLKKLLKVVYDLFLER